jgi:hypothetical protein
VEQQLAPGMGKWQVAEFVEHDEVLAAEVVGQTPLSSGPALGLQLVNQVDDVEEPPTCAVADAGACDGDGQVRLAGAGRTRGILPNIMTPTGGSFIGITLATVRAW